MTTQTEVKHTPGPWRRGFKGLGGEALCYKVYGADNQEIATVGRWNSVEDEATARLIVSAPEMLAMLYSVPPSVEQADEFNNPSNKLGPVVLALISKAEGRI